MAEQVKRANEKVEEVVNTPSLVKMLDAIDKAAMAQLPNGDETANFHMHLNLARIALGKIQESESE